MTSVSPFEVARRGLSRATGRLHSMPILILMPHSRCNCRCVMCDIWKANRDGRELSREDLEPHLEDLRRLRVRWVVLSGGEALMHRNLWAFCEPLRELGVRLTLLSTGLLLGPRATEVVRWCDEVIVSLDGGPTVHDAIRNVPRAYERLAEGVAAVKDEDPAFPVRGRTVLQRRNYADVPDIVESARALGLDSISFLAADVSSTAFNRPEGWPEERVDDVALDGEEAVELAALMEEVIVDFAAEIESGFVVESPDKLRDIARYFLALSGQSELPDVRCDAPWVSAVVEADGTVRPCFFHRALGNVHEARLAEILNGREAVAFRRRLDVARDPVCRRCTCSLSLGLRAPVGRGPDTAV